eukprot:snap_masked-scaffold175_size286436-processed-gene-1.14 protein:Tk09291 transcript:snap_masked-scaffold175_size286436-processed-gene-1.14-mRNA-1 annotation:"furin-like convertase"
MCCISSVLLWSEHVAVASSPRSNLDNIFHNQFALFIPKGQDTADALAAKHGFVNLGQIGALDNYFLFEHARLRKRSALPARGHSLLLTEEPEVEWFEQQEERRRVKRDGQVQAGVLGGDDANLIDEHSGNVGINKRPLWDDIFAEGEKASPPKQVFKRQNTFSGQFTRSSSRSDPMYGQQWHLNHGAKGGFDMNVEPAWSRGYTGKGVVVTILDDGIQTNHPDLIQNYDPLASTDINGNDHDPMPQDNGDNKHGTRCAGEVAASADNGYCGVGVAYNASIGGVRMLDGVVNDAVEARALSLNPDHVDIYSASWGPEDDGKTVDGPGPLAKRAFLNGVVRGRNGKGSIFIWASGNGGRHLDNCNCDGYTNSIFTLSISSATQGGYRPWYLEECSSTLASTYSSGTPGRDGSITTVDQDARLRNEHICTDSHTGTSASAPIAAGVSALALEANPGLTWRDLQYLVVMSSRHEPLAEEPGWFVNGAGRRFSHKFGYGLMDAGKMTELARSWKTLPQQHICQSGVMVADLSIPDRVGSPATVSTKSDACGGSLNSVQFLEHVQCKVSLRYYPRGNIMIVLTSPSGTRSTLLFPRPRDSFATTFEEWPFLSVHFWGENPTGTWKLEVMNMGSDPPNRSGQGILRKWQLIFYGTQENPVRVPRNVGNFRTGKQSSGFNVPSTFTFQPSKPLFTFPNFFSAFKRFKRENREEEEVDPLETSVAAADRMTTLADVYLLLEFTLDFPELGQVQGGNLFSLFDLLLFIHELLNPFMVFIVLILLETELLGSSLHSSLILLVLHQSPLFIIQISLELLETLLQTLADLAASAQSHLLSLVQLGLHVFHLGIEAATVSLKVLSSLLLGSKLFSQSSSIHHGLLGLLLGDSRLSEHLFQFRLVKETTIGKLFHDVVQILLGGSPRSVRLLQLSLGLLQLVLEGMSPSFSLYKVLPCPVSNCLLVLQLTLALLDLLLVLLDGPVCLRIGRIGVLQSGVKLVDVGLELLLHPLSLTLGSGFTLQGELHALEGLLVGFPDGLELKLLLLDPSLNFLFDLRQLQMTSEHLVLLLLQSGFGLLQSRLKFQLLSLQAFPDLVNLVNITPTLADLVHDVFDLYAEGAVLLANGFQLHLVLLISGLDLEQVGGVRATFHLSSIQFPLERIHLGLPFNNDSVEVSGLLLHLVAALTGLIHVGGHVLDFGLEVDLFLLEVDCLGVQGLNDPLGLGQPRLKLHLGGLKLFSLRQTLGLVLLAPIVDVPVGLGELTSTVVLGLMLLLHLIANEVHLMLEISELAEEIGPFLALIIGYPPLLVQLGRQISPHLLQGHVVGFQLLQLSKEVGILHDNLLFGVLEV